MKKITISGNQENEFITDDKTSMVYLSSLIDTKSGALDLNTRSDLKPKIIEFSDHRCELLYNTMDVWARDYMPIQLTQDVFLGYTYKPDYLVEYPNCVTNWQLHGVHADNKLKLEGSVVQMPIILDGGNVVKAQLNGNPCFIMCEKVLKENNVSRKAFDVWWHKWWNDNFEGTRMEYVLLPWEGKRLNRIGHADGMVRYIGGNRVLMTNYLDFDKKAGENSSKKIGSNLEQALTDAKFDVKKIEFWDKFRDDPRFLELLDESWCYINYLQIGNRILVPSLGYKELDEEARKQIEDAFDNNAVSVKLIDVNMTPIVKEINKKQNSGGALNCLTWTIKR